MSDAFTVYWTRECCDRLRRLGWEGRRLDQLFGGPHTSEPSFLRAGVRPGDWLYPITVRLGVLQLMGSTRVRSTHSLQDYVTQEASTFVPFLSEKPTVVRVAEAFERFRAAHPEIRALAPSCTEEVIVCEDGTPLRFDAPISADLLAQLRFRSVRRERDLSRHLRDGVLTQYMPVQGIYRLAASSADLLEAAVRAEKPDIDSVQARR